MWTCGLMDGEGRACGKEFNSKAAMQAHQRRAHALRHAWLSSLRAQHPFYIILSGPMENLRLEVTAVDEEVPQLRPSNMNVHGSRDRDHLTLEWIWSSSSPHLVAFVLSRLRTCKATYNIEPKELPEKVDAKI